MRYVIAYDVSDDKIRLAISEVLEGFGTRVQKSVFECELEGDGLEVLTEMLRRALDSPKNGQVRFYRLCADCFDVAYGIGEVEAAGAEPASYRSRQSRISFGEPVGDWPWGAAQCGSTSLERST